jgi:hypothetical protein
MGPHFIHLGYFHAFRHSANDPISAWHIALYIKSSSGIFIKFDKPAILEKFQILRYTVYAQNKNNFYLYFVLI